MKTTKKRILAILLVALMVMFNVPFVGFAIDNPDYTYAKSTQNIVPTFVEGNTPTGKDGDPQQFPTTTWETYKGVTYRYYLDTEDKQRLEWYVEEGYYFVGDIKMKGGNDHFVYTYTDGLQINDDSQLRCPNNGGLNIPDISHICIVGVVKPMPKGSLEITKEVVWGQYVPSTSESFTIKITGPSYPVGDTKVITVVPSTWSNSATWSNLIVGTYTIEEVGVNELLWTTTYSAKSITIKEDQKSNATIVNTYEPRGSFALIKNMSSDSAPLPKDKTFTFDIYEKVDSPQVPNEIEESPQVTPVSLPFKTVSVTIGKGLTSASASVELPYGSYFVSERDANNPGSSFSLVTPSNNRIDITINGSNGQQAIFTNKYVAPTGVITVIKKIEQAKIVPAALPLNPNFAFDIINVETDEVVQSFTLPQNGLYQFTSASLPLGTYKVHEKSMDPGFKVVENDKTVVINHEGAAVSPYMVTIENLYDPNLGNLIVKKSIESTVVGVPIPGRATFEFELRQDDVVVKVDGKDSFFIDTLGGNGQVTLNGLEEGTYTITEINLGYNYTVSPAAVTVKVDANATVTAQTITNYYTPDPEIQIEVLKVIVDANGSPVSSQNDVNFTLALEPTEPTSEYDYEVLATKSLQRTTFKNLFTFSVNAKDKDALSYQEYPFGFTRAYDMEETNLPQYFGFKSFKIDYHFGDEVVTETSTENDFELRIFGQDRESYPDKIVITVTNTYTPPTPPVIPPEDDEPRERRIIPTEPVPLASPTTEAAVPEEVPEELLPLAPVTLPKTGEVPATLFYGIGGMISALGVFLRRK